ncbi:MAG: SDR family oxidoreductase [Flavobacteriaceae bacterium]
MKLLIIGGTGKTGRQLVQLGLEQGHTLTLLVRNPRKMRTEHANPFVEKGNVLVPEDLEKSIKGQDAVLCALGHKRFFIKTDILSKGTENMIEAMKKHGVRRLICITSLGINDSRFRLGLYYTLFTIPLILFFYFRDKARQERIIWESELDWTIIRPGQLTNGKRRGTYRHGPNLGSYILTKLISRADVADFMLSQLKDTTYLQKTTGITY